MQQEDMHYPLHLGVTEAGDGEDGRIKSAIGIGSLLLDGLGDTIRVSLTEDSVYEIPVARAIADKAMQQWRENHAAPPRPLTLAAAGTAELDPYHFTRRLTTTLPLAATCLIGPAQPPRVIVPTTLNALAATSQSLAAPKFKDTPADGLLVPINTAADLAAVAEFKFSADQPVQFLVLELNAQLSPIALESTLAGAPRRFMLTREFGPADSTIFSQFLTLVRRHGQLLAAQIALEDFSAYTPLLGPLGDASLIFTLAARHPTPSSGHALGAYRQLAKNLTELGSQAPIWIRNTSANALQNDPSYLSRLLEASFLSGSLLCDGLGDLISIETEPDVGRATLLAYNVLQGAGARLSKTEFVACPSCGRTLFDLQSTTQRIRAQTGHLKGVKLAIMGCIVNGPGEMADADFGYVGGAPGKINLYVGKNCVQYNIPEAEADARLIALMREHGKWAEPEASAATPTD
jgi:(E)-4-hydroxy-3-methylbut-2-enyl-diphosphate synthase